MSAFNAIGGVISALIDAHRADFGLTPRDLKEASSSEPRIIPLSGGEVPPEILKLIRRRIEEGE